MEKSAWVWIHRKSIAISDTNFSKLKLLYPLPDIALNSKKRSFSLLLLGKIKHIVQGVVEGVNPPCTHILPLNMRTRMLLSFGYLEILAYLLISFNAKGSPCLI